MKSLRIFSVTSRLAIGCPRRAVLRCIHAIPLVVLIASLSSKAIGDPGAPSQGAKIVHAAIHNTTLRGQVILGYQGWFSCPDDRPGADWDHWVGPGGVPAIDMLPDTSEFPQQPGCRAPFLKDSQGKPVMLYSARNPDTVDVQIKWLQQYGISGVAVQRFVSALINPASRRDRDVVLTNVQRSSEHYGRVFFVTYDISGAGADWADVVKRDWQALVTSGVTRSSAYLNHDGRPVVEIWGIGFDDRPAKPSEALELMLFFSKNADPQLRASILAGVPVSWRDQTSRNGTNPSWMDVYRLASALSPWFIGAVFDAATERKQIERHIGGDVALAQSTGQVYMPVVFPGFSSANQTHKPEYFQHPARGCGKFLEMQTTALLRLGVDSFYVAMFDELNEGTAVLKPRVGQVVSSRSTTANFITLDPTCPDEQTLYLRKLGDLSARLGKLSRIH